MPFLNSLNGFAIEQFAIVALFLQADIVVKCVVALLLTEMIALIAIYCSNLLKTRRLHRAADAFEARFWSGINLDEFYDEPKVAAPHSLATLFEAGMTEWRRETPPTGSPDGWGGPRDRIARQMQIALRGEVAKLGETRAIWNPLRTIGLCLGLFGIIFGIMTSVAAAASEPTGDVRIALPGIAAALLPMALSVVTTAAATLMRYHTGKEIARYCLRSEVFVDEFLLIFSLHYKQR